MLEVRNLSGQKTWRSFNIGCKVLHNNDLQSMCIWFRADMPNPVFLGDMGSKNKAYFLWQFLHSEYLEY